MSHRFRLCAVLCCAFSLVTFIRVLSECMHAKLACHELRMRCTSEEPQISWEKLSRNFDAIYGKYFIKISIDFTREPTIAEGEHLPAILLQSRKLGLICIHSVLSPSSAARFLLACRALCVLRFFLLISSLKLTTTNNNKSDFQLCRASFWRTIRGSSLRAREISISFWCL